MKTPYSGDEYSRRRLAENELLFKELNERIDKVIKRSFGQQEHDIIVDFYCECSDETCRERVAITPAAFRRAHDDEMLFVVKKGHETPKIENIVKEADSYNVVRKFEPPPKTIELDVMS